MLSISWLSLNFTDHFRVADPVPDTNLDGSGYFVPVFEMRSDSDPDFKIWPDPAQNHLNLLSKNYEDPDLGFFRR